MHAIDTGGWCSLCSVQFHAKVQVSAAVIEGFLEIPADLHLSNLDRTAYSQLGISSMYIRSYCADLDLFSNECLHIRILSSQPAHRLLKSVCCPQIQT